MERAIVPCNGCTACCRGQRIMLTEKEINSGRYMTELTKKGFGSIERMLAHKSNGDCWYLGEHGCTIHNSAPKTCREFDCRVWLKGFAPSDWGKLGPLDRETVEAAKARL